MRHRRIIAVLALVLAICAVSGAQNETRRALVIGNSAYEYFDPLSNPANDADDMGRALEAVGFWVTTLIDAGYQEMDEAVYEFGRSLATEGGVGLFYYAGHGIEVGGTNYLIPVDALIRAEDEVRFRSVPVDQVLVKMESARNGTNIVILDACRDNPLPASARSAGSSRGLSVVAAPTGSLVVYATAPGQIAQDGDGRNGVFTGALLSHIATPGVDVMEMLRAVRRDVIAATGGDQTPWENSSLTGAFYFAGSATASAPVRPTPPPSLQPTVGEIRITVQTGGQLSLDGAPLGELADGQSATLRDVPTGRRSLVMEYDGEQETVLVTVATNTSVSARFEFERPTVGEIEITVRTGGRLSLDGQYQRELAAGQSVTLQDVPAGRHSLVVDYGGEQETVLVTVAANMLASAGFEYERRLQRPDSLETVLVESGTFQMGSPSGGDDDERPVHSVTLGSFWMTVTEITFAQYDQFFRATGRDLPDDEGWGRGTRPVINVSWHDAVEYANWLSEQDGLAPAYRISRTEVTWNRSASGWRLPTEAEWEYAARGGTRTQQTTYAGSNTVGEVAWYEDNSRTATGFLGLAQRERTHPVGEKQANELGLYDMSGNVWEWCWDWYGGYGSESQHNPTGTASGLDRVLRGGSHVNSAIGTRVADRYNFYASRRYSNLGFRLVAPAVH